MKKLIIYPFCNFLEKNFSCNCHASCGFLTFYDVTWMNTLNENQWRIWVREKVGGLNARVRRSEEAMDERGNGCLVSVCDFIPEFMSFMRCTWIKCFAHYALTISSIIHMCIQASSAVSDYVNCIYLKNKILFVGFCLNPVDAIWLPHGCVRTCVIQYQSKSHSYVWFKGYVKKSDAGE